MTLSVAIITCTVLAGVFALTVAILQIIKQREDEKNNTKIAHANEKKQIEISDLQAKLLHRSDSLIDRQEKVISLQNELSQKNNKIQELQNETLNNLTGGTGIPKILFSVGPSALLAFVNNDAKYPITNISGNFTEVIEDFDTISDGKTLHPIEYSRLLPFDIGEVMSGNQKLFYRINYDKTYKSILIVYNIGWRNGYYTGAFRIKNKGKSINSIIEDAKLTMYSKGLDLHGVVKINDLVSPIMPFRQP